MPRTLVCLLLITSLGVFGCSHPQTEESAVEAASPKASQTLYDRLGGDENLTVFADRFIQQMALSDTLMKNPLVAGAMSRDQKNHKEKLTILLCQLAGGPCKYQGQSVKSTHAPLKITQAEWKEMTRIFIQVLQRLNVPKKERQELAKLIARYKNQIVVTK